MNALMRLSAIAATAAALLVFAQPSHAVTPAAQPHSILAGANGDALARSIAYRGRTVYRGGGVYRRGVYRPGLRLGAAAGYYAGTYGQPCGYAPYPPCGTGYYGGVYPGGVYRGGIYRGGVAYRGGVYRRGVYRGGGRVTHYRRTAGRRR